jgi:hypothetical protein
MKMPQIQMKKPFFVIAAVGYKGAGKSTALSFIADALWDMGVKYIKHKNSELISNKPNVVLWDDVEGISYIDKVRQAGGIVIYISNPLVPFHRKNLVTGEYECDENQRWVDHCSPDFVLNNDSDLRRFDFVVRDFMKNLIVNNKQWKEAVEYV